MNTLLIVSSVILTIIWAIGLFIFSIGAVMHLAMVCALLFIIVRILRNEKQFSI